MCGVVWCGVVWCGVVWCGVCVVQLCMHILNMFIQRARAHTHTHIHTQTHIGRKRWVLFPPGTPKALVKPAAWMAKKDREAIDWFLCHYRCVHACVCVY